jgi:CheY-specific phosphatase CheX
MGVNTLDPMLVQSLEKASLEILETMVFMKATGIAEVPERSQFTDEVVGLLGFTGTRSGTFCVRATEQLAKVIAAKMLMMEPAEMASFAEAADGFGELVNMIGGNFKNTWVGLGNRMDLSVPNVIYKGQVRVDTDREGAVRTCVRVDLPDGALLIGVHFEP